MWTNLIFRLWLWLLLKIYKAMCTCKGKCGCSSTTITTGPAGADGRTILNGVIAPTISVGSNGDFYINTATDEIYGPKTAGVWGSPTSLIGAAGATGGVGPQGPAGTNGGIIVFKTTNSVASTTYTALDNLSITNLVNDNDTIEIESVIRYGNTIETTMTGYKFQVAGIDIHEYVSAQFDNTNFKYLIHNATITRLSSTVVNIISEIKVTDDSGIVSPIQYPNPSPEQTFSYLSPAITSAAILPITFLLKSDNSADNANKGKQVVLRINYSPKYTV